MVDKDTIVKPNKITDEDLLRVHTEDYLNSLKVKIYKAFLVLLKQCSIKIYLLILSLSKGQ